MVVLTQLPLKSILRNADYTGRIAKWGIILRAFDISWPNIHTNSLTLESVCGWSSKPAGIKSGASFDIS